MSNTMKRPITAEEFLLMPYTVDGMLQERARGEIVPLPVPGGRHGASSSIISRRIGNFVEQHGLGSVASNHTGFITERDPDTVREPDISFWSTCRLPEI